MMGKGEESSGGRVRASALAEAAYLTGLERNADASPAFVGRAENASRIAGYRTQFAGLFRDGTVPTRPEI